jgi:hypothetical protein
MLSEAQFGMTSKLGRSPGRRVENQIGTGTFFVSSRGRRRDACPRSARVQTTDTRCKRRDGAWVVETYDREDEATGDGRVCSGGAVFADSKRRVGPLALQKQ